MYRTRIHITRLTTVAVAAILCLLIYDCSGGFDKDGAGADELGPIIFGDSTRRNP